MQDVQECHRAVHLGEPHEPLDVHACLCIPAGLQSLRIVCQRQLCGTSTGTTSAEQECNAIEMGSGEIV